MTTCPDDIPFITKKHKVYDAIQAPSLKYNSMVIESQRPFIESQRPFIESQRPFIEPVVIVKTPTDSRRCVSDALSLLNRRAIHPPRDTP